eukprot:TRINITY_DN2211_c0_g1_i1.p1 TRINITY_DN2211_c0_g1~~TRINITY_DN2211_c0_g1_i1.p1  ORF type:complete len:509 (+),score=72.97 TRINITY_DN2211_c0_g1_i1:1346-2872(+)
MDIRTAPISKITTSKRVRSAKTNLHQTANNLGVDDVISKNLPADPAVQQEYIKNLQQQVYFLELETGLLKDKINQEGPKMKNRATDTGPSLDPNMQRASVLEDHMMNLKMKYVSLEDEYIEKINNLENNVASLEEQLSVSLQKQTSLENRVDEMNENQQLLEDEWNIEKNNLIEDKLNAEKETKKIERENFELNEKIERLNSRIKALVNQHKENGDIISQLRKDLKDSQDMCSEQKAKIEHLELSKSECLLKIDKLEALGFSGKLDEIRQNFDQKLNEVKSEKLQLNLQYENLIMQHEQLKNANTTLNDINENLRKTIAQSKQDVVAAQLKQEEAEQKLEEKHKKLLSVRLLLESQTEDINIIEQIRSECELLKQEYNNQLEDLRIEKHNLRKERIELDNEIDELTQEKLSLKQYLSEITEELNISLIDAEQRSQQLYSINEELFKKKNDYAELLEEHTDLQGLYNDAQNKLGIANKVLKTRLHEFKTVHDSSLQMADTLGNLLQQLQ